MSDSDGREVLEHVQAAARELIAAGRALLDLADELVRDPSVVVGLVASVVLPRRDDRPPASPVERIEVQIEGRTPPDEAAN